MTPKETKPKEKYSSSDFILIQADKNDKYYEIARIRPYIDDNGNFDENLGYYCDGFAQNNGKIYEFNYHIGTNENPIQTHKIINIGYPIEDGYVGQKIEIENYDNNTH